MIKRLTLLGLLRGQALHGYGLLDYLESHSSGEAAIGKANAYRLLSAMEKDGLIASAKARDGRRPERRVYRVTSAGERFFQDGILRELGEGMTSAAPGLVALNYIDQVDPEAACTRLAVRRERVREREERLRQVPEDVLRLHPALDLELRHVATELQWIDDTLERIGLELAAARRQVG
ncbi:MAG: PadR family transcriptional regulator [Gammaproteobacteria bacterium]|nr:PadR family transcriptional regulator [Gammaproteobacteria bacterium]